MKILKNALDEAYDYTHNLMNRTNLPKTNQMMYSCQNWNIKKIMQLVSTIEKIAQGLKNKQK